MGGRGIFRLQEFFFLLTTCARIFFLGETLCTIFFFKQKLLFSQWNLDSLSIFVLYKLFYTRNRSCGPFFNYVWKIFSKMYWEEGVTLSGQLPYTFLQSLPSGIPRIKMGLQALTELPSRRNSPFKSFVRARISSSIWLLNGTIMESLNISLSCNTRSCVFRRTLHQRGAVRCHRSVWFPLSSERHL